MGSWKDDPFALVAPEEGADLFGELASREAVSVQAAPALPGAATARLHGFDLNDQPLVVGLPGLAHEIVPARTTVALLEQHVGTDVVVLFDQGDVRQPIIVGAFFDGRRPARAAGSELVSAQVDDQRLLLTAEREIVLRCGDASITLTRAGKVVIKGRYVVSRASGYNRIKGSVVDIN